jgi:DNA mismatch repair protein MutS2
MHALKVLEFETVMEQVAAHAETALGRAATASRRPSFDREEVEVRLNAAREATALLNQDPPPSLFAVKDLAHAATRAEKGGVLGAVELVQAQESMAAMRRHRQFLAAKTERLPWIAEQSANLTEEPTVERALEASLDPDGSVRDEASPLLGELRRRKRSLTGQIQERIQGYLSGRTREYLSDPIYTVRDGRYVIPVRAEHRGKIRGIVHDTSGSGQTVFVEPEDVLQLGNRLRQAEGEEREEEVRILTTLSQRFGTIAEPFRRGLRAVEALDAVYASVRYGFAEGGCLPEQLLHQPGIAIRKGRHPLLAADYAVPLDLEVGLEQNILITGPNTGGKTVAIKTVGLFAALLQSGVPVPAQAVEFGAFTQIWADIGDEQSLAQSLSTFSGHIKNIGEALAGLKPGALVLLDEVGAGTDPAEGAALARAILEEMRARGAVVLASTHYGELKAFAYETPGFVNAAMEFDLKSLRPTYRLLVGAAGSSQALRIASRYGIPEPLLDSARQYLGRQAQDLSRMMEELDRSQRRARQAQSEADRRQAEVNRVAAEADRKLAEAEEIRRTASARANEIIESALREIRLEAQRLFEELKAAPRDAARQAKVRADLKALDEVGRDFARDISPAAARGPAPASLQRGQAVRVAGFSQPGVLLEDPKEGKALVQLGVLRMTVEADRLSPTAAPALSRRGVANSVERTARAKGEVLLIEKRAEDAERELEKFLDEAILAGLPSVRIVHGKGEGVLRHLTHRLLRRNPNVSDFRDGEPGEGGHGVTIAALK